jgi:hypothetical protein
MTISPRPAGTQTAFPCLLSLVSSTRKSLFAHYSFSVYVLVYSNSWILLFCVPSGRKNGKGLHRRSLGMEFIGSQSVTSLRNLHEIPSRTIKRKEKALQEISQGPNRQYYQYYPLSVIRQYSSIPQISSSLNGTNALNLPYPHTGSNCKTAPLGFRRRTMRISPPRHGCHCVRCILIRNGRSWDGAAYKHVLVGIPFWCTFRDQVFEYLWLLHMQRCWGQLQSELRDEPPVLVLRNSIARKLSTPAVCTHFYWCNSADKRFLLKVLFSFCFLMLRLNEKLSLFITEEAILATLARISLYFYPFVKAVRLGV